MSEYIEFAVRVPKDKADSFIARFGKGNVRILGFLLGEEIVRCRDCEHYRKHKWFKVVVGTPLGTDISDVCMFFADGCKVEPNGFCAWAVKRKEGGE